MAKIEIPLKKDYAGAFKYWVDTNTENGVCTIPEYICKGIVGMLGKQLVATDTNVGDIISRQAAIDSLDCINGVEEVLRSLPSAQPERTCVNCGRTANNGGWYADGGTRCPIEEHYALPKDGYCHLWEKRNITDDDYPERRTDG